jgi:hypothetical protein
MGGEEALGRFIHYIINPFILLVFATGMMLFMVGFVQFMWNLNKGGDSSSGKQHMLWGVIGMLIMVSFYGIIAILSNTFQLGVDPRNPSGYNPDVSGTTIPAPVNFFK